MRGVLEERAGQRLVPGDKSGGRGGGERMGGKEREKDVGGGQGPPFKRGCSKCTQEVLLMAAAEDLTCQAPKGRPVQRPKY